jgi:hypothetical protein
MNLLLDTHVFIWWSISPKRLSSQVENSIANFVLATQAPVVFPTGLDTPLSLDS